MKFNREESKTMKTYDPVTAARPLLERLAERLATGALPPHAKGTMPFAAEHAELKCLLQQYARAQFNPELDADDFAALLIIEAMILQYHAM
jgi:hypothetical protein